MNQNIFSENVSGLSFTDMKFKAPLPPFRKFKAKIFAGNSQVSKFIYQLGESNILRNPSKEVSINEIKNPKMQSKFRYLKKCFLNYKELTGFGRGIAAVQVGILERFAYVDTGKDILLIINPKITKSSKEKLKYPEGCMSLSPLVVPVIRPSWIEFEYYNERGGKQFWNTKDNTKIGRGLNRVFQHEIDHLNGILCLDRVDSTKELFLLSDPNYYKSDHYEKV